GGVLGFALKAADAVFGSQLLGPGDLESDGAFEGGIVGLVDPAEDALADETADLEAADACRRSGGRGRGSWCGRRRRVQDHCAGARGSSVVKDGLLGWLCGIEGELAARTGD